LSNNINPRYLDATDKFTKEEVENANKSADYWYYNIGANVIPAYTKRKEASILNSWKQYQSNPLALEVFERWKELGLFANGIAVVLGQLWRGKSAGKFLNLIDADNRLALEEICCWNGKSNSIEQLASWTLVEQHNDDINRGHIYILSTNPFPTKASDKGKPDTANKIVTNEIPGLEVKNVGSLSFGWNSIHEGGQGRFKHKKERMRVFDLFVKLLLSHCIYCVGYRKRCTIYCMECYLFSCKGQGTRIKTCSYSSGIKWLDQ
jgi:hypothetical protein